MWLSSVCGINGVVCGVLFLPLIAKFPLTGTTHDPSSSEPKIMDEVATLLPRCLVRHQHAACPTCTCV
jgi:hypothetical protein